jgi:hypothetical protein
VNRIRLRRVIRPGTTSASVRATSGHAESRLRRLLTPYPASGRSPQTGEGVAFKFFEHHLDQMAPETHTTTIATSMVSGVPTRMKSAKR